MPSYVGRNKGRTEVGQLERSDVAEFLQSCRNAGWTRAAVAEGMQILGAMNENGTWVHPSVTS